MVSLFFLSDAGWKESTNQQITESAHQPRLLRHAGALPTLIPRNDVYILFNSLITESAHQPISTSPQIAIDVKIATSANSTPLTAISPSKGKKILK